LIELTKIVKNSVKSRRNIEIITKTCKNKYTIYTKNVVKGKQLLRVGVGAKQKYSRYLPTKDNNNSMGLVIQKIWAI